MKHIITIIILLSTILFSCTNNRTDESRSDTVPEQAKSRHDIVGDSLANLDKQYILGDLYLGMDSLSYWDIDRQIVRELNGNDIRLFNLNFDRFYPSYHNGIVYEITLRGEKATDFRIRDFSSFANRCEKQANNFIDSLTVKYGKPDYTLFDKWTSPSSIPYNATHVVAWLFPTRKIEFKYFIQERRRISDVQIVNLHWTLSYSIEKPISQEEAASAKAKSDSLDIELNKANEYNSQITKNL